MQGGKHTYSKISECGTYGFKPYGPHTDGGELWAWINTDYAMCVIDDIWHPDEMEEAIYEFKVEMKMLTISEFMKEVDA
jgi:hypothetical protein